MTAKPGTPGSHNEAASAGPRHGLWAVLAMAALITCYLGWRALATPSGEFEKAWRSGVAAGFNVVVVTLDTTRADRLACYGYRGASTPVLDRLANEGVLFADAVSCVPMTLPAHASIFTGLDPPNHGVRSNGLYSLGDEHVTLAEMLSQHGYETAGFISAFVLDKRYGLSQGFDYFDDRVAPISGSGVVQRRGGEVTDAALDWLDARDDETPYFLWVHYFDPHLGYDPPSPFREQFAEHPYDGEIAYMDAQIGRLVEAIGQGTHREKTLMVVVGDHGESHGEHHEGTHSRTIYEATQHVPLIMWAPGIDTTPYRVDDVVVGIIDVFPAIIDLLGISADRRFDGASLLACRAALNREVYMETMRTYLDHQWAPLFGIRRHEDKYILAPKPEYFDLEADPDELRNRYGELGDTAEVKTLAESLAARIDRDPLEEAVAAAAAAIQPDEDALRRLQSLGYVSGSESDELELPPDPKDMMPTLELILKARSLRQAGRLAEALARAQEALVESPNDRTVLRELGTIYAKQDNIQGAEDAFVKYLKLKPDADVCWTLAQILMQTGRHEQARETLEQALEIEPSHGGALLALGDLAAAEQNYKQALRFYEQAKQVDPYRIERMATTRIDRLLLQFDGDPPNSVGADPSDSP